MWNIRNDLICFGTLSRTSRDIPQPVVAYNTGKLSRWGQWFIFGPTNHFFHSAPEECWIFVLVNIPLSFAVRYWFGITKILIYSFKQLTRFSWNGTTGKPFFPIRFWVSSRANLQFQVPSSCHYPNIFCLILRRSSELHLIDLSTPQLLPVYCQVCIRISCFEVVLVFCLCFICNFVCFIRS